MKKCKFGGFLLAGISCVLFSQTELIKKELLDAGFLALLKSAERGDDVAVGALLEAGVSPKSNRTNVNPLMEAAYSGHEKVVQRLLGKIEVDEQNRFTGVTALMRAVDAGHEKTVRVLLNARASVDLQDMLGRSALYWAVEDLENKINNPFWGARIRRWEDYCAAKKKRIRIIQMLLDAGANIDLPDAAGGATLLAREAYMGHEEMVAMLLFAGANTDPSEKGWSPVMYAAYEEEEGIVSLLLSNGARIPKKERWEREHCEKKCRPFYVDAFDAKRAQEAAQLIQRRAELIKNEIINQGSTELG